ncbi:MAG: flagellar protein FlaG [Lachnospiraceae bacterium]
MAIETLSGAMTYQAQPVQSAQSAKSAQITEKSATEYKDRAVQEAVQPVDGKAVIVAQADQKEDGDNAAYGSKKDQNQEKLQLELEKIRKAVDDLNKNMPNSEALFGIHEATNRVTIKIVDKETREVIKELPPEKTLDMIAKVWEMAGLMVDERR